MGSFPGLSERCHRGVAIVAMDDLWQRRRCCHVAIEKIEKQRHRQRKKARKSNTFYTMLPMLPFFYR